MLPRALRSRRIARALLLVAAIAVVDPRAALLSSGATLTGSTASTGNLFSAGSVQLGASPTTALVTATSLKPGDAVSGSVVVSNTGTLALRYAMTTATTNPDGKGLSGQLQLVVREAGTSCAAFDGLELYNGLLGAGALGSASAGAQAGDRVLNASTAETLCFKVSLPVSTPIAYESASTTATFTFVAEQTASNP